MDLMPYLKVKKPGGKKPKVCSGCKKPMGNCTCKGGK